KLRIHLERKNPCKPSNAQNPIVAPTPLLQNPATNQIPTQTYITVGDLIQLDGTPSSPIQSSDNISSNLSQNDTEWFDNMEDKYNTNTDEKWPELGGSLLYDYPKRNIINIE
ncbi:14930_t:CDS:1, partial [Racocetra persica]